MVVSHKKFHFVFNCNSGIFLVIFVICVPVETGVNMLVFTYLMA